MKRNLILSIAVAVFMVATTVAQAADVSFSGEFRPRFNVDNDSSDLTDDFYQDQEEDQMGNDGQDIDAIKEYYSCSYRKAHEIAQILSGDQLSLIYKSMKRGGLTHGKLSK